MVEVRTSDGVLEGEIKEAKFGEQYYSFKGIPYAKPPIGELRFKAPQPPDQWQGVREAKEFGPICHQVDMFKKEAPTGCEDCLYLNVYTPNIKPHKPLPVMFWIHGGGFFWGSGNDDFYGPDFLIAQNVVLVTFNYRLEVVGFLCLDTKDVPGNAGMKDQVAAMRWVQKNIHNFGGDPNNVTIFGESAGAASVGYHLISPMSKGLFKRAILQSGSCNCSFAQSFEHYELAVLLASKLGFDSRDPKELYEFFKLQPIESLILANVPLTYSDTKPYMSLTWSVVSEKQFDDNERFFYGNVDEELRDNIHEGVEVMAGYVADEAVGILGIMGVENIKIQMEHINKFIEMLVPKPISLNCTTEDTLEIGKKFREYYLKNQPVTFDNFDYFLKFKSFDMLIYHIIKFLQLSAKKNKTYAYKFSMKSKRNIFSKIYKLDQVYGDRTFVAHCDDLPYLFESNYMKQDIDKNSKEFEMIQQVTKLWTNFAKFGNPTPHFEPGVQWPVYSIEGQHYMDIGEELKVCSKPEAEEFKFWEDIFTKYLPQS